MAKLDFDALNSSIRYLMFSVFAVDPGQLGDERDAARYRLAEVHLTLGDTAAAVAILREVSPGYRDRDAILAEYGA